MFFLITERLDQRFAGLTEREREVLDQLLLGKTSKEIARILAISPRTAEVHRRNLLHKLGFRTVKELMLVLASRV